MSELPTFSLLAPWAASKQGAFIESLNRLNYPDEGVIFEKGDTSTDVYFILQGSVKAVNYGPNGQVCFLRMRHEGDCFGYYSAISQAPRTTSMLAVGPVVLATMSAQAFFELVAQDPEIAKIFIKLLVRLLRAETERLTDLTTLPAYHRVVSCLLTQSAEWGGSNFYIPNRIEFAGYLGMSRETLSRILSDLTVQGLIQIDGHKISILNENSLKKMLKTLNS